MPVTRDIIIIIIFIQASLVSALTKLMNIQLR